MINVSNEFKRQLYNDNRNYLEYADITLSDGTVLNLTNKDLWSGGISIEDAVSSDNSFDIGSAIVNKCTVTINNIYEDYSDYDFGGAQVIASVGLKLPDGRIEKVKKGVFTVDEPKYNGSIITLSCLDNMHKFDIPYSNSNLTYPATLGAIVRDACSCCNVLLAAGSATFDNDDFVVDTRPDDKSLTFRQVLVWVGQISCHWCRCDVNGRLSLDWYNQALFEKNKLIYDGGSFEPWTTGDTVDGGTFNPWTTGDVLDGGSFEEMKSFHHIYGLFSVEMSTDDVVITGVRVTEEVEGEEGSEDVIYQSGTDGYVLGISDNKLIQGKGSEVATYLGNKLNGLQFRPLTVTTLSNPTIEAGDIAFVTDRKNNTYATLITETTFQAQNSQKVTCGAQSPTSKSSERFSAVTQVYQELRQKLNRNKTEWEKAIENLGQRLDTSSGLYSTIEKADDGSSIFYLHDKPTLAESEIVWKMTAEAWGVSTDGGKTWNGGMTVDGEVIARILYTIGVNADWINTGALVVRDSKGNILFNADVDTGRVDIVANSFSLQGKSIDEIAEQQVNEFVNAIYDPKIQDLQNQIDGQIESWYYDYEPTLTNAPASEWTTENEKSKHEGDLFYWKSKGFAYRFYKDGNTWKWQMVQDTDITKALAQAAEAQDTADGKRRVFTVTPTPPYDSGDMWITSTENEKGAIKICKTSRQSGTFVSTDWIDPKYVDESAVDNAITEYDTSLGQTEVFNKLTNGGKTKGIYIEDGELYINASYILSGVLAGKLINGKGLNVIDKDNQVTLKIDDDGHVYIKATEFSLEGKSLDEVVEEKSDKFVTLNVILSNEYQGIPTDMNGAYTSFPSCSTTVKVLYGSEDVTTTSTIQWAPSNGVSGSASGATYTVTGLSADTGTVKVTVSRGNLSVEKIFTIAKQKQGVQGLQGLQGKDGANGINGVDGKDGKTTYFHIKYSSVANPTSSSQMTETPSTYIGTYVDFTEADSADPKKYTWSKFEGRDGSQGIPGTNGTDGKTSYLHIAYATSSDGNTGFSVSDSNGKTYIGQYTDFASADSTDPSRYSWSKIKGEQGATGNGISSIITYYLASSSSSGVNTSTYGWTTYPQTPTSSKPYLWSYQTTIYTNGNTSDTTPHIIGIRGSDGQDADNLTQQEIFDILTNNGTNQGIYLYNGQIFINATKIDTGDLCGWTIDRVNKRIYCEVGYNKVFLDAKNGRVRTEGDTQAFGGYGYAALQGNDVYCDTLHALALATPSGKSMTLNELLSAIENGGGGGSGGTVTIPQDLEINTLTVKKKTIKGPIKFYVLKSPGSFFETHPIGTVDLSDSTMSIQNDIHYIYSTLTGIAIYGSFGAYGGYSLRSIATATSDIRLKKNISKATIKALPVIMEIGMYQFDWKQDGSHQNIGFIADYLEELDERMAIGGGYDSGGGMIEKSVNDFYLLGYVVKAMQEMNDIVENQKKQIDEQAKKIESLESRLDRLEQMIGGGAIGD